MIAGHVALSYRIGSVKEIPTWLGTSHLVALSWFYALKFRNYRKKEEKCRGRLEVFLLRKVEIERSRAL